jgi:ribosomal protein L34E
MNALQLGTNRILQMIELNVKKTGVHGISKTGLEGKRFSSAQKKINRPFGRLISERRKR